MKRKNLKHKRIIFIACSFFISLVALVFIITNFRDNIVFFYSPSELKTVEISANKTIRVGGLVKKGSIKYLTDGVMEFTVTDLKEDLGSLLFKTSEKTFASTTIHIIKIKDIRL